MPASPSSPSRRDRKSRQAVASLKARAASPDGTRASRSPGRHTSNSSATGDSARSRTEPDAQGLAKHQSARPAGTHRGRYGHESDSNHAASRNTTNDRATETPGQRAVRFERAALPYLAQLYPTARRLVPDAARRDRLHQQEPAGLDRRAARQLHPWPDDL